MMFAMREKVWSERRRGEDLEGERQWKKHEGKASQSERRLKMFIWHLMLWRNSWPCLLNRSLWTPFLAAEWAVQQQRLTLQTVIKTSHLPKKQPLSLLWGIKCPAWIWWGGGEECFKSQKTAFGTILHISPSPYSLCFTFVFLCQAKGSPKSCNIPLLFYA